jgi:hypothetical protein
VFDGEAIPGPGAEVTEGGEARDALRITRREHRIALGALRPRLPLRRSSSVTGRSE